MKKLEELDISPAPWVGDKTIDRGKYTHTVTCGKTGELVCLAKKSDARFIAASPRMYEALAAFVSMIEDGHSLKGGDAITDMLMVYANKALAEAAGEIEVK